MKNKFNIVLSLLLLSSGMVFSQGYIPVTTTMSTPYGNVQYTNYVPGPVNRYYINLNKLGNSSSMTYEFKVVMKNDSSFTAKTKINVKDDKHHTIVIKNKKVKTVIHPSETKSLSRVTVDGQKISGIPADSCWLFKTYSGRINTYSFLAEPGMSLITAIQDGDEGAIIPLTKENLLEMVEYDDPKVHQLIETDDLVAAIKLYNKKKK